MDELSELILARMLEVYTDALEKIPASVAPGAARDSAAFTAIAEQLTELWWHVVAVGCLAAIGRPGANPVVGERIVAMLRKKWGIPARDLDS